MVHVIFDKIKIIQKPGQHSLETLQNGIRLVDLFIYIFDFFLYS